MVHDCISYMKRQCRVPVSGRYAQVSMHENHVAMRELETLFASTGRPAFQVVSVQWLSECLSVGVGDSLSVQVSSNGSA